MTFSTWSGTASNNTSINSVNIAENCPAGNTNDMGRQIMADMRNAISPFAETILDDVDAAAVRGTISAAQNTAALSSVAALTPAADKLAYYTGAGTAALTTLSSFARTLLDDVDQATARNTLGALGVSASSLGANGYITLSNGLTIQWGSTSTVAGEGAQSVSFPTPFASACFTCVCSLKGLNSTSNDMWANMVSVNASGFTAIYQAASGGNNGYGLFWIAVGN